MYVFLLVDDVYAIFNKLYDKKKTKNNRNMPKLQHLFVSILFAPQLFGNKFH